MKIFLKAVLKRQSVQKYIQYSYRKTTEVYARSAPQDSPLSSSTCKDGVKRQKPHKLFFPNVAPFNTRRLNEVGMPV